MKHTNDVEEGQNVNTLSEIEEYYKAREQQLLKKLYQQGAALAAAEQALKQLTENQKVSEDETARQRAAREQAFEEKLYRDPLTGIYNRRYYEEVARKTIGPAGVALMDVDDFKICNDTYGHYAGDMALKTVANTIQSCIRKSDLLIRYGGDEFLLVLPGIPGDFLQTKLEQIHTAAQMASVPGYSHFRISLSIGGTIQSLADPMDNIVRRADWLMYQAKCRKNAVMVEVPGCSLAAPEKLLQEKSQILLVDDSKMNRMLLREILGDGYNILEAENGQLKQDIADLQERVKAEQAEQKNMEHRHYSEINKIYRAHQQETMQYDERLKRIDTYFPHVKELLPIADQCREMGFTEEMTRQLVCFKPVGFRGKLYSREHGKEFKTEHSTATIERNPQQTGKFRLCIDGMPILEWFKMKLQELKEKLGASCAPKEIKGVKKGLKL